MSEAQLELEMGFDESIATNVAECLPPGIYRDIPFEQYAAMRAFNSGVIKWGRVTIKHMLAAFEGRLKSEDTRDRKLGRGIHRRVLEPGRPLVISRRCAGTVKARNGEVCGKAGKFVSTEPIHLEDQFRQCEHCLTNAGWELTTVSAFGSWYFEKGKARIRVSDHDPNVKTANWLNEVSGPDIRVGGRMQVMPQLKAALRDEPMEPLTFWYCGVHKPEGSIEPVDYVSEDEAMRIEKILAALHDHPAMPLLKQNGWSEVSIVWEFEGLLLKGRLDRYAEGPPPVVLDLKKMQVGKGSKLDCQTAIIKNGYLDQAAIYAKGVQHFTGMLPAVIWLFQEDNEPYDTQIILATPEEIELAWADVAERLRTFKRCRDEGVYPGYVKLDREGRIIGDPGACPAWWHKMKQEMGRA